MEKEEEKQNECSTVDDELPLLALKSTIWASN